MQAHRSHAMNLRADCAAFINAVVGSCGLWCLSAGRRRLAERDVEFAFLERRIQDELIKAVEP
jgi:hypothetical protein